MIDTDSPRKFNVVRFDDTYEVLFDDAVMADRENIDIALRFVRNLQADGGTEMAPALSSALGLPEVPRLMRQVVFITDGAVGNASDLRPEPVSNPSRGMQ